jgi:hypothetical protein
MFLPILVLAIACASPAPPTTVDARARAEFAQCYRDVLEEVTDCSDGRCGELLGGCYDRQLRVIDADSDRLLLRLQGGRCRAEADSLEEAHARWRKALEGTRPFKEKWSSMDLRVETALLRDHALLALLAECGKSR